MTLEFCPNKASKLRKDKALGYIYFIDKNHPLCHKSNGKVYQHRHVASIKEGRWVCNDEIIHHIDGDKSNNSPNNLIVMSASEHCKMHRTEVLKRDPFYGVKITVFRYRKEKESKPIRTARVVGVAVRINCEICGTETINKRFCSYKCSAKASRKAERPSFNELSQMINSMPCTKIAQKYGVSDVAIKKWANEMGLKTKPRGYWSKLIS